MLLQQLPIVDECFVGARPHTQCLDIAHGLQSVIEKGVDSFGNAAVAQYDIKKYYDSLPVLRIVLWLISRGAQRGHAVCLLRHQMCPVVLLCTGMVQLEIKARTIGGLTGSRTAGMLGRIPVESTIAERHTHWRKHGFAAGSNVLCICTYVDNLFSASKTLDGAISILEDFETHLNEKWDLRIKQNSRACMVAAGALPLQSEKWPCVNQFNALGHLLTMNGSIRPCWLRTKRSMWKAFWGNPGSLQARHLCVSVRLKLLDRAVAPALDYRSSRWPPQKMIAQELDAAHKKMVATVLRVPRQLGEEAPDYVKRRGRLAACACQKSGKWSQRWFKRATNEHLERPRNGNSWPAKLLHHMDRDWFRQRRFSLLPAQSQNGSCLAGRTNTRAFQGRVHSRWHDGIEYARTG